MLRILILKSGCPPTADLTGYITGIGVVIIHTVHGDVQFDKFYRFGRDTVPLPCL